MAESDDAYRHGGSELGFTLIELLIVIVVLGVLAAVAVFALGGVTQTSAVAACNSDAQTVNTAIEAYNANTGGTPTVTAALLTDGPTPYLHSWPSNSSYYAISIVGGVLMVAAPFTATPAAYLTSNQCPNAAGSAALTVLSGPTGVTGTCLSPNLKNIIVTWNAVAGASYYAVYNSVTSATSGYTQIASYVAGTSFETGSLGLSTEWFEVTAHVGSAITQYSTASAPRSITNGPGCL